MTEIVRSLGGELVRYTLILKEDEASGDGPRFTLSVPPGGRSFENQSLYLDKETIDSFASTAKQMLLDYKKEENEKDCTFQKFQSGSPAFVIDAEYGIDGDGDVHVVHPDGSTSYEDAEMILAFCHNSIRVCRVLNQMLENAEEGNAD